MKRVMFLLLLAMAIASEVQAQTWPHEPAGATVINDWSWDSCPGGGWQPAYGCAVIRSDDTAPMSRPYVLMMELNPNTCFGGGDPYTILPNLNEIYIGTWVKLSNPFQGIYNNANKLMVASWNDGSWMWIQAKGPQGGPWWPYVGFQATYMTSEFFGSHTFKPGTWHRLEVYFKRSSTAGSRDGIVRIWFDGQLSVNRTSENTPQASFQALYTTPTWDGSECSDSATKRTNLDTISFDHIHVSTSGSGGTPKGDATPPAAPTSLRAN